MTRTKKTLPPDRLKGERSGDALIAAMQASPYREIDIEPTRGRMPVRGVDPWR